MHLFKRTEDTRKRFSLFSRKNQSTSSLPTTSTETRHRPLSVQLDSHSVTSFCAAVPFDSPQEDRDTYLQLGMKYHEEGQLEKATYYWRLSAQGGSALGLFFYGIALRHGWGCKQNPGKAIHYLLNAAQSAVCELQSGVSQSTTVAKSELVLAIYEIGVCFRHGWGVPKDSKAAFHHFQVAANLGDPDAQNDLGFSYLHGIGVKKDVYASAKYYRMAERQGQGMIGNSWIWKDKYNDESSSRG